MAELEPAVTVMMLLLLAMLSAAYVMAAVCLVAWCRDIKSGAKSPGGQQHPGGFLNDKLPIAQMKTLLASNTCVSFCSGPACVPEYKAPMPIHHDRRILCTRHPHPDLCLCSRWSCPCILCGDLLPLFLEDQATQAISIQSGPGWLAVLSAAGGRVKASTLHTALRHMMHTCQVSLPRC